MIAIPAAGLVTLLTGAFAGRRRLAAWTKNPDPLNGQPVEFPDAELRTVPLDDGAEIAVWIAGSGPTIVLVHGLTASHHDWGPMARHLIDAGYRLVAVDQRGHGNSTAGTKGYGSRQLGTDLGDVFTALDLHAVCLVGHSMGAMASMGFATGHSSVFAERVQSFVSIASAGATNSVRQTFGLRLGAISLPEQLTKIDAQRLRLIAGLGVFGRNPSLHMVEEAVTAFRRCPEAVRAPATAALGSHDLLEELTGVHVPTLVIGSGRDRLIDVDQVRELDAAFPNSQLHIYEDAGHMVLWERHKDLAARTDRFVQSVLASMSV